MNKDRDLEQLLRSMGQAGIERPDGLISQTTQRMRSALPEKRGKRVGRIEKNIRFVMATTFLLLLGFTVTWAALPLLSGQPSLGKSINLSGDPRIIAAAAQLEYDLALPTNIPQGSRLGDVNVDEQRLTLIFVGPPEDEPVTMVQSPHLDQFFPHDTVFIDFSAGGDAATPITRGLLFESRREGGGGTIVFRHGQSFVTLHSAAPAPRSETPLTPLVSVAMSIIGANRVDISAPQDEFSLAKDAGAVPPPKGSLQYQGFRLVANCDERICTELVFRFDDYLYTCRFTDPRSLAPTDGAMQVDINGSIGYFSEENNDMKLLFGINSADVEIAGPQGEGALVQEDFLRLARWIVNSQFTTAIKISDLNSTTDCRKSFIDLAAGDVPLLKFGEIIELDFAGDPPDSVQVFDHFLTDSGEIPYDDRTIIEREAEFHGDKVRLPVEFHFASVLSSQYPPPPSKRGFRIICTWGEDTREYALVIKTD